MVVIGGREGGFYGDTTSSVEMIGFDNCSVPDLPETRYHHGGFVTSWGSLAVCGGYWSGKPASSDCLVLNTTSRQWERGVLGGLLGDAVVGVVTLDVGTYMVHATTSSFLPLGEREWIPGPNSTQSVHCVSGISAESYLVIGGDYFGGRSVLQFDSSNDQGWLPDDVWPDLQTWRQGPGCATLGDMCVVAGGNTRSGEVLKSVEVIFLQSKTSRQTSDMLEPRSYFKLIVLRKRLLAIGSRNETSMEAWEGLDEPWRLASESLILSRSHFSALPVDDRVCLEEPLPPHSCPTLDGGTCVFPFRNGNNQVVFQLVTVHLFHQDLKPIALVLKSRTTDIGV